MMMIYYFTIPLICLLESSTMQALFICLLDKTKFLVEGSNKPGIMVLTLFTSV